MSPIKARRNADHYLERAVARTQWIATLGLTGMIVATGLVKAEQVTAEEVVERCADALGGRAAIEKIETLRLRYVLPDHGAPIRMEVKRPNRLRTGDAVVFDGKRAALLERPPQPDGTPNPARRVDAEEWKDNEVEIGKYFPAFFDYPSKYGGVEVIEGIETHKLKVELPMGGELTYFVEASTHLPLMVESRITLYGKNYRSIKMFGDYRETAGILYPHEFTYYSPHMKRLFRIVFEKVELNVPLPDSRFEVPAGLYEAD